MVMAGDVHVIVDALQQRGRTVKPRTVNRLIEYWNRRTHLTREGVCKAIHEDIQQGSQIGLRKRGFE